MGWLFTDGQTRADLIRRRIEPWSNNGTEATCLAHACVGNVLWTVWEHRKSDGSTVRHIGCDLMRGQKGYGWGYKDMCESMHPYYYSCPLKYLEMVPQVACEKWRAGVREYHDRRRAQMDKLKSIRPGDRLELKGANIPHVIVRQVRPLKGEYRGLLYRVPRRLIA